jgi:hypothetical protein
MCNRFFRKLSNAQCHMLIDFPGNLIIRSNHIAIKLSAKLKCILGSFMELRLFAFLWLAKGY